MKTLTITSISAFLLFLGFHSQGQKADSILLGMEEHDELIRSSEQALQEVASAVNELVSNEIERNEIGYEQIKDYVDAEYWDSNTSHSAVPPATAIGNRFHSVMLSTYLLGDLPNAVERYGMLQVAHFQPVKLECVGKDSVLATLHFEMFWGNDSVKLHKVGQEARILNRKTEQGWQSSIRFLGFKSSAPFSTTYVSDGVSLGNLVLDTASLSGYSEVFSGDTITFRIGLKTFDSVSSYRYIAGLDTLKPTRFIPLDSGITVDIKTEEGIHNQLLASVDSTFFSGKGNYINFVTPEIGGDSVVFDFSFNGLRVKSHRYFSITNLGTTVPVIDTVTCTCEKKNKHEAYVSIDWSSVGIKNVIIELEDKNGKNLKYRDLKDESQTSRVHPNTGKVEKIIDPRALPKKQTEVFLTISDNRDGLKQRTQRTIPCGELQQTSKEIYPRGKARKIHNRLVESGQKEGSYVYSVFGRFWRRLVGIDID